MPSPCRLKLLRPPERHLLPQLSVVARKEIVKLLIVAELPNNPNVKCLVQTRAVGTPRDEIIEIEKTEIGIGKGLAITMVAPKAGTTEGQSEETAKKIGTTERGDAVAQTPSSSKEDTITHQERQLVHRQSETETAKSHCRAHAQRKKLGEVDQDNALMTEIEAGVEVALEGVVKMAIMEAKTR